MSAAVLTEYERPNGDGSKNLRLVVSNPAKKPERAPPKPPKPPEVPPIVRLLALACEWRVGCASGCNHAKSGAECALHIDCAVVSGTCFGSGCRLPPYNSEVMTAEECATTTDCNWEPSCWDAPNTDCDYKLDETECARRNCRWLLHVPSLRRRAGAHRASP